MGQKLREDRIGTLSHSSGTITLGPSVLTIGGQQYVTTSSVSRTISSDVTMTNFSRYMIYAVVVSNIVQLRISSNLNSVGPAGFNRWKLVGAFYVDGATVPAFGEFTNIEGAPSSQKIFLRYFSTAAQSFPTGSPQQLSFATKATAGVPANMPDVVWNGSQATIPVTGRWKANIHKDLVNLSPGGVHFSIEARINGVGVDSQELFGWCNTAAEGSGQSRPMSLYLTQGQILTFFGVHSNGTTRTSSANGGFNFLTLELVEDFSLSKIPLKDQ